MSALSPDPVAAYWQRGVAHVPGLFGAADVARMKEECDRLVGADAGDHFDTPESFPRHDPSGRLVRNLIDPVLPRSPLFRRLLAEPAVTSVLRDVLGDEPRLFKDKLILRPPGTSGYGLHQDFAYWGWTGAAPDQLLALQIAIDDADESSGAVCFHPEMHRALLPAWANEGSDIDRTVLDPARAELIPTRAGDAIFFHSLTPHLSGRNESRQHRRTLYLTYNAGAAGDLYRIYYQDRGDAVGGAA